MINAEDFTKIEEVNTDTDACTILYFLSKDINIAEKYYKDFTYGASLSELPNKSENETVVGLEITIELERETGKLFCDPYFGPVIDDGNGSSVPDISDILDYTDEEILNLIRLSDDKDLVAKAEKNLCPSDYER